MYEYKEALKRALKRAEGYMAYSGRAMFGEFCPGIVGKTAFEALARAFEEVARELPPEEALDAVLWLTENARSDGMGLEEIVYWPELRLDEDEVEEEYEAEGLY